MPLPLASRSENAALSEPARPVSEIAGNMAARAMPICALAAIIVCSAARMSGRRSSSIEGRSEEHTSELQSRLHLVCRLLLEKKKRHDKDLHNNRQWRYQPC